MQCYRMGVMATLVAGVIGLSCSSAGAGWPTLLDEQFDDDPVAAGRATLVGEDAADRFAHDAEAGKVTAAYDAHQPLAQMNWSLGRTLTQDDTFRFDVDFTIDTLDPAGGSVAFGLINSTTTGWDRGGGTYDESVAAWDLMTATYFPTITQWGGPNLGTSIIESDEGQGYLMQFDDDGNLTSPGAINFPFGPEGDMAGYTLPEEIQMTAEVAYSADERMATLRMIADGEPLEINLMGDGGEGGPDGDTTTIQTLLPDEYGFAVDTFSLPLWEDTWDSETVTTGELSFGRATVSVIPEPHAGVMMSLGVLALLRRRRTRRSRPAAGHGRWA